ncbi:hypothetical protein LINPERHAP1_LOCUS39513 [Linum perenne]
METSTHHPNKGIQERRKLGSSIPKEPADEDLLQPMERRRLGY